jgi:hypothetical protein
MIKDMIGTLRIATMGNPPFPLPTKKAEMQATIQNRI